MKTELKYALVISGVVLALVLFLYLIYRYDQAAREDCLRREGHIENYTTQGMSCSTHHTGSYSYTDCHPTTYHHWRCTK